MAANAGIFFRMDGYDTSRPALMGRQAAGEGFLRAFARHANVEELVCVALHKNEFEDFNKRVDPYCQPGLSRRWVPLSGLDQLNNVGALFLPGPGLAEYGWYRRRWSQRGFSLCGVTHTTATHRVLQTIGEFLSGPVQPWDAVICTSQAVKDTVDYLIQTQGEYLMSRYGLPKPPPCPAQLPVIPLGVELEQFDDQPATRRARARWREKLNLTEDDVALLFVGRLAWEDKLNPVAMIRAAEIAAQRTGRRLKCIVAGWFPSKKHEADYQAGARALAPSCSFYFLDGRQQPVRTGVWFAGDIFVSLSDNIQETFGLTPIEAMAAGLPVVASDWNGYKDTVRHNVDGFLVPTIMPPKGTAEDISFAHSINYFSYQQYVGSWSLATAVDIEATAQAIIKLVENPALRKKMGDSARQNVREKFDWPVVIAQYQELWAQLAEIRKNAEEVAPKTAQQPAHPVRDDISLLFGHYPTRCMDEKDILTLRPGVDGNELQSMLNLKMVNFVPETMLPAAQIAELMEMIRQQGALSIAEVMEPYRAKRRERQVWRSVGWLAKTGLINVTPG